MNRQPIKRSTIFLMELIIVILFFCLAGTLCIQLFVKAHLMSNRSRELTISVNEVSSAAALLENTQDAKSLLQKQYPFAKEEDGSFIVYYTKEWNVCTADEAIYSMDVRLNNENGFHTGDVTMYNVTENRIIYQIDIQKHLAAKP